MSKGKSYRQRKNRKSDNYYTPFCLTRELLEREKFEGSILEPASGTGAIIKVLLEEGYNPDFYDINDGTNFLEEKESYDNIITNPPFSLANEFILKAKELYNSKIAMLLPLNYLHGQTRYELEIFKQLKKVYIFTRYPMLTDTIREDGMIEKTGMQVYAWYVWSKSWQASPVIDWIDINKYIVRSKNGKDK